MFVLYVMAINTFILRKEYIMIKLFITSVIILIFTLSCSETKDPVASVSHETGWLDPISNVFHAGKVQTVGALSCRSCHGEKTENGIEYSFCFECHQNYPEVSYPHTFNWMTFDNPSSHGAFVITHPNSLTCYQCHTGTHTQDISCNDCH